MGKLNRHSKHRAMIVQNVVQYYVDINVEVLHQITYCVHTVDYRLGHAWLAFHSTRDVTIKVLNSRLCNVHSCLAVCYRYFDKLFITNINKIVKLDNSKLRCGSK